MRGDGAAADDEAAGAGSAGLDVRKKSSSADMVVGANLRTGRSACEQIARPL